ncbi:MAG: hypothetical protein HMLKMBBP_03559 [Planctomycetes bacterium]|nr:hypothetical protein [Planctomycetota bacterium]
MFVAALALFRGPAFDGSRLPADSVDTNDVSYVGVVFEQWAAAVREGRLPLWFPEFDAGAPLGAAWMYGLLSPSLALFALLPLGTAWAWTAAIHMGIGAAGMAAFTGRRLRGTAGAGAAGAISAGLLYGLSEFMVGRTACGHLNLVLPMAYLPWALRFADGAVRGERRAIPLLGLTFGFGLLSGHVQMWTYLAPMLAAFVVFESRTGADAPRALLRGAAGLALGCGVAAAQVLLTFGYLRQCAGQFADPDVLHAVSVPAGTLATKLLHGWTPPPAEAGTSLDFRHEHRGIAGLGAFALAAAGFALRARGRWFWTSVALIGAVAAMGTRNPLSAFIQESVPPFSLTRAPGRALVLVAVAVSVLAAHGASALAAWTAARLGAGFGWVVPAAAALHALLVGAPVVGDISATTHTLDWTARLPAEAAAHRIHAGVGGAVSAYNLTNFERWGFRTLRPPCYIRHEGYELLSQQGRAEAPWWLDLGLQFVPEWGPFDARHDRVPPPDALVAIDVRKFDTMGAARVVASAERALSDAAALARMNTGDRALLVHDASVPAADLAPGPAFDARRATAVRRTFAGGSFDVDVTAPAACWLQVSERWDTGWHAEIDGAPAPVHRSNLALLAVRLPAGARTVRFTYRPGWFIAGAALSLASAAACIALALRSRAHPS